MFDFLTGFLLGIIFAIAVISFGVYKLLLRSDEERDPYPAFNFKHTINQYSMKEQGTETCAWLNMIVKRLCVEALSSPVLLETLNSKLHEVLNGPEKREVLGKIIVSDMNLGSNLPTVDGIRVFPQAHDDSLHAEISLGYMGGASFTISTDLWANLPTSKFACLPVSLHVVFEQFKGTLKVSCHWLTANRAVLLVYFSSPPVYKLPIGSTIGHDAKLVNVSKVSQVLQGVIQSFVHKELVAPNGLEIELLNGKVVTAKKRTDVVAASSPEKLQKPSSHHLHEHGKDAITATTTMHKRQTMSFSCT